MKQLNKKGFTLIEIIVVLLILGILSATILPKYFAMEDDAIEKTLEGVVAELQARANLAFGHGALNDIPYAERKPNIDDFDGKETVYEIRERPLPDRKQFITVVMPNGINYPVLYTPPRGGQGETSAPCYFEVFRDFNDHR